MNALRLTLIAFCVLGLSACPSTKDPLQYKTAGAKEARLDVPPDLTTPKGDSRYTIPSGGSASANQTQTDPSKTHSYSSEILKNIKDMHIERDGKQRWLVIEGKTPAEVWPVLKVFWREMGFVIKSEEPEIGLMETDWAENRAKLPNDGLRGLLEKVGVGSVYSTPERDKFVIRMENTSQGTEVFFSHKGLYEIYTTEKKDNTAWQPRPTDPELEAAFLARFMIRLGMSEDAAQQQLATTGTTNVTLNGNVFAGNFTVTAPDITPNGGTYNGAATFNKTGGTSNHNNGNLNIFNSTCTINQTSSTGYFMLGYNSADQS